MAPPVPDSAKGVVTRVYANLGKLLGGKAAAGVISLGYITLAARTLGPADYGVLVLVHAYALTVGGIIEFPGWHAVVRYGAHAQNDRARLGRIVMFAGALELAAAALAILVCAATAPFLGARLGWSPQALQLAVPYSLAVLATMRATPAGYLQLIGRFDLLGAHSAIGPMVRLVGAVIAVLIHADLKGFMIVWLIAAIAEGGSMWLLGLYGAKGRLSRGDLRGGLGAAQRENPGLMRFMLGANADVTLTELAGRVTPLAIGWLLGPAAAGLYAIAQRATVVLAQPAITLGQAAYAELARLAASGADGRTIRHALGRAILVAACAAVPVGVLIIVFNRQLAVLIGGQAFAGAGAVMVWLAVARAIQLAAPPISAALTALGRPGLSVRANIAGSLGLLVVLPPLCAWMGLVGAGVQALIQALVVVGLLTIFLLRETRPRLTGALAVGEV
jgi:O-antigen/teichoic acid export membrane protein